MIPGILIKCKWKRPSIASGVLTALILFCTLFVITVSDSDSAIRQIWANNGEDKVTQDELRASSGYNVANSVWDGNQISLFGAKNEVVSFNLIIEADSEGSDHVSVSFDLLTGADQATIASKPVSGNGVFDWTGRNIELFYIRYLEIKGLSHDLCYDASYDERHVPERFRRPWTGKGQATGGWQGRPDHNKRYPDIAVPLELVGQFDVAASTNQSVWVDIFIPKTAPEGIYEGTISINENNGQSYSIPVSLNVLRFTLPDLPSARTMLSYSAEDINARYLGSEYPDPESEDYHTSMAIINRHFQLAHRHKISLIDNYIEIDEMENFWIDRLSGSLFTESEGYDGPGIATGNNVYSIGTYGSWAWSDAWSENSKSDMWANSDAWVDWFDQQAFITPTDYFIYLVDESDDYMTTEKWAHWIDSNPGSGKELLSMATISSPEAWEEDMPSLDIPASSISLGIADLWEEATTALVENPGKRFYFYNGARPGSGSFCTEDDGVALRVNGWIQYKKKIDRWFYWESTYYDNYQGEQGPTDVFSRAQTYGYRENGLDQEFGRGEYGWNYTNGDGVLFYPGTDRVYTNQSYGVGGPFASLRLKHWRRGLQDMDYLSLANSADSQGTQAIVQRMIPKVLWEYGVEDEADPTYVYTDISWSTDPDDWETARAELAAIIERVPDSGNLIAYIPHITGGYADWNDMLQVDNPSSASSDFLLTLYDASGEVVHSASHGAAAYSRSEIMVKDLAGAETAACGIITYSEPLLNFRLSQENLTGGGLTEFRLDGQLGKTIAFFFTDFISSVELKGLALTNFSGTSVTVTLTAMGNGSLLGTEQVVIGPNQKIIGLYTNWFPQVSLDDIQIIQASTDDSALSGVCISGNAASTHLLFTTGVIYE